MPAAGESSTKKKPAQCQWMLNGPATRLGRLTRRRTMCGTFRRTNAANCTNSNGRRWSGPRSSWRAALIGLAPWLGLMPW
jgi:hypothetical protein